MIKRASGALLGSGSAMLQNQHATSGPTDSNIVINSCTIDGNCGSQDNAKTAGIQLYAQPGSKVANVAISNSTIQNTLSQGIYGFSWQNVEIAANIFINDAGATNVNDGAIINNLISTNGASTKVSVHHNRCDSTLSATTQEVQSGSSAIETKGGGQIQIEDNRFVNNHGIGLNLSFVSQGVNFTIKNNYYNGEVAFLVPHSTTITQQSSNIVNGVIQ